MSEHRNRLIEVAAEIERLHFTGEVPSEKDLDVERSRRQHGWRLIRSAWLDGHRDETAESTWIASLLPEASLADAYDVAVTRSDQTADRLRREANRVTEQAVLLAEQIATKERLAAAEQELLQHEANLRAAENRWKMLWQPAGIEPRSPKEMRSWLDQWQVLVQRARERQTKADNLQAKKQELQGDVADLELALQACGGLSSGPGRRSSLRACEKMGTGSGRPMQNPDDIDDQPVPVPIFSHALSELVDLTNQRIKEAGELRQKRQSLETDIKRLTNQCAKATHESQVAERKKAEWVQQWDAALRFLEPKERLLPEEANRALDTLAEFWKKINDIKGLNARMEGMETRSGGFPQAVFALAEQLDGRKPDAEEALRVHEQLQDRLREAELNEDRRLRKLDEREQLRRRIEEQGQSIQGLEQQLQRLCQEAQVENPDELPRAIGCSEERRDNEEKLQECESDLQLQGGMADLQMLVRVVDQAVQEHRDYALEKKALEQEIAVKRAALDEVNKQIGAAQEAGRALQARAGAGESAAELESEYALLRRHVEEYGSLVLTSCALREAIQRYRKGSSTGLLGEASTIFRLLTCGSFDRLAIAEGDDGTPYLVGVRPDDSEVGVEGMSDGTCDQLYLALRPGTPEAVCGEGRPLPPHRG